MSSSSRDEAIALLGALEADDRPGLVRAGPSDGFDPVVAVLEDQLVVIAGDDDRRRFEALRRCADSGRRRRRATRRRRPPASPARPAGRPTGAAGPAAPEAGPASNGAARTAGRRGRRCRSPGSGGTPRPSRQLITLGRGSGRVRRELLAIAHDRAPYPIGYGRRSPCVRGNALQVAGFVVGAQHPAVLDGSCSHSVIPVFAGAGVRWWRGPRMPSSSRIDAMITPAWHTATTVCPACSRASRVERSAHPLVEAVPALAARSEGPIGLGLHVEGAVAFVVLGPVHAVGLAGVDLAEVAVLTGELQPETRAR